MEFAATVWTTSIEGASASPDRTDTSISPSSCEKRRLCLIAAIAGIRLSSDPQGMTATLRRLARPTLVVTSLRLISPAVGNGHMASGRGQTRTTAVAVSLYRNARTRLLVAQKGRALDGTTENSTSVSSLAKRPSLPPNGRSIVRRPVTTS